MRKTFLLLVSVLLSTQFSFAQRFDDDLRKFSVLVAGFKGNVGTGFLAISSANQMFLCTARHVLISDNKFMSDSLQVRYYANDTERDPVGIVIVDLNQAVRSGGVYTDSTNDVIVVPLAQVEKTPTVSGNVALQLFPWVLKVTPKFYALGFSKTATVEFEKVQAGSNVLVAGYPLSVQNDQKIDFTRPLFRSGIVSTKDFSVRRILTTAAVYPGNSGGLAHCEVYEERGPTYYVMGFITSFTATIEVVEGYHKKTKKHKKKDAVQITKVENAGYSVIIPIEFVFRLMNTKRNY